MEVKSDATPPCSDAAPSRSEDAPGSLPPPRGSYDDLAKNYFQNEPSPAAKEARARVSNAVPGIGSSVP